jgi:Icc-related predicted phosphoesterase
MNRRDFIGKLGKGLIAGWAAAHLSWPRCTAASTPAISLAFLADPHLIDGNDQRPEALSLARAVTEIKSQKPTPHLALVAGDLAHDGNPKALALGEEILSELPMPILAVRGEGDGCPVKGQAGWKTFSQGRFVYDCEGINLLGLDTGRQNTPTGPAFVLGETQHRWLARVLSRLDPAQPLVILSHAPLTSIFRPWGQWTVDSGPLIDRLSRFHQVLCFHGHVHHSGRPAGAGLGLENFCHPPTLKTANRKPLAHLALPATSWPLPLPQQGTPKKLRPGLGPRGCGWALLNKCGQSLQLHQRLWEA